MPSRVSMKLHFNDYLVLKVQDWLHFSNQFKHVMFWSPSPSYQSLTHIHTISQFQTPPPTHTFLPPQRWSYRFTALGPTEASIIFIRLIFSLKNSIFEGLGMIMGKGNLKKNAVRVCFRQSLWGRQTQILLRILSEFSFGSQGITESCVQANSLYRGKPQKKGSIQFHWRHSSLF